MADRKNSFFEGGKKKQGPSGQEPKDNFPGPLFVWMLIFLGVFYMLRLGAGGLDATVQTISYGDFYNLLTQEGKGRIKTAVRSGEEISGTLDDGKAYVVYVPLHDPELESALKQKALRYEIKPEKNFLWMQFFNTILGPVIFVGLLWLLFYRKGGAGGIMSFGKSRAKQAPGSQQISFKDVAGVDEAKGELQEVVDYLKEPKRFQRLGGRIPKGVLLVGPPGTGKTLLAKAISGEAGVPFFSISGSDFVEMFVGVGASRVRDLFDQAKKAAKVGGKGAIIFMDEIDAVGRQRFAGIGGGHDEREQTLNALLVEMDGYGTHEAVIVIAATNRPDVLDPALLRPGRFDRVVMVPRPDLVGREAILKVHALKIKLGQGADLGLIAKQTMNFSGADLANLVNEAALLAARLNKESVGLEELQESIERVIAGPQRKSHKVSDKERKITAYHEAGHAIVSIYLPGPHPVHKITIIGRGMAGGYTMFVPEEESNIISRKYFLSELPVSLGGRAAEEIIFGDVTTGAQDDLRKVTQIAKDMVCQYGMSEKIGNMALGRDQHMVFLGRDIGEERNYSEDTARLIDIEVKKFVDEAYKKAKETLIQYRDKLELLAKTLMEKETLESQEIKDLLALPGDLPTVNGDGARAA